MSTAEARGMEKGKHKKVLEIALELKKAGFPLAKIAQFTELSVEEIEDLK